MALLIDKVSPGRSALARSPDDKEIRVTTILSIPLEEVSAKIRVGPPVDDAEDMTVPVWAGVVPLALRAGAPQPPDGPSAQEPPRLPGALVEAPRDRPGSGRSSICPRSRVAPVGTSTMETRYGRLTIDRRDGVHRLGADSGIQVDDDGGRRRGLDAALLHRERRLLEHVEHEQALLSSGGAMAEKLAVPRMKAWIMPIASSALLSENVGDVKVVRGSERPTSASDAGAASAMPAGSDDAYVAGSTPSWGRATRSDSWPW